MVHEMAATPRALRREQASERILDAAERILGSEGLEALTMQRLASELGLTVGAAYRYFPSKEAIVAALQRRVLVALSDDLAGALALAIDDPLERIAVVARLYTTLAARRPLHAGLISRMMGDPANLVDAESGAANTRVALEIGAIGVRELAAAREAGALAAGSDVERTLALFAALTGTVQTRKLERWGIPGLSADALASEVLRALLVGWGAEPERAAAAIVRAAESSEARSARGGKSKAMQKEKKR